jgi:PAS domain S-box-containing protein
METEFRKTGISVVVDMASGTHFCHLNETKEDLLDTLVLYFKAGLESKAFCVRGLANAGLLAKARSLLGFKHYFVTLLHSLTVEIKEIPLLLIVLLALVSPSALAQTAVETPRTIRVVIDNAYAPYSFQSDEGKLEGILIDQWQAWEKKTGIKVDIHAMDWDEALRRMRAGEFDVIDSIVETVERRSYFDFTPAYATIEASIFFRNDISGIADLASLKGFPVGVKAGDQHIDKLKANGVASMIVFQSNDAIIEAAKQHKINVFVADAPSALYLLNKAGIEAEFRQSAPVFRDQLRRAVRKGDAATLRTVSEGFAAIAPGELTQIDEKWFGRTINRYGRSLTYAAYAAGVAILLIAGLVRWNRALRKRILQRTAALRESEQRFRQIAENIHEVFWLTTVDTSKTLYVSPAYETVWGRTCESLYQDPHSFIAAIHPEDDARVVELLGRNPERDFEIEYRVVRPDGSIRWIRDRAFPIKDESGHFYRIAGIAEDITERKQAEDALRRSEDRIRLIIDTIPTMAWSLGPDAVLDFVNQRWLDYTGLSFEQAIEEPTRIVHPEDLSRALEKWLVVKATSEAYEDEMRLQQADGEYRWFLIRIAPLLDEQGNVLKRYGVAIEIEARKQAEEALRESEERFRQMAENIREVFWMCTADLSKTLYISPAYEVVWGQSCESLYRDLRSVFAAIHPDDRTRAVTIIEAGSERGFEVEYRVVRPDGSIRWIWDRGFPIKDESGRSYRLAGIAEDITERKRAEDALRRSEDQLRLVIDTIPTMAWSLGPDGVIDFVNQRWQDYTGLSLEEEIKEPTRPMHPEDLARAMEKWRSNMAAGEPSEDEMRLRRADGEYRWFLIRTAPLRDEQGNLAKWFGVSIDIEDRKRAEEKLKATSEQLRALSARLQSAREEEGTRIARELHDELGSALTSLKLDLELIRSKEFPSASDADFARLREKTKIMMQLIDQTVETVRRISSELRPSILDDIGLVAAIRWHAKQFEAQAGIVCLCDFRLEDVDLDRQQSTAIFRVFQEALTNILRHAQANKVDVTLEKEDHELVLTIRDNGRGITAGEKSDPLSLGLLGMRERVNLIGGTIHIAGVEGKGTEITVRVRLMTADESNTASLALGVGHREDLS